MILVAAKLSKKRKFTLRSYPTRWCKRCLIQLRKRLPRRKRSGQSMHQCPLLLAPQIAKRTKSCCRETTGWRKMSSFSRCTRICSAYLNSWRWVMTNWETAARPSNTWSRKLIARLQTTSGRSSIRERSKTSAESSSPSTAIRSST